MPPPVTDEVLAARARKGDRQAAAEIVQRFYRSAHALATRMLRDADAARDAAQEAFVRALSKLEQFDPAYRFSAWLFKIVVNLVRDEMRRHGRVIVLDLEPDEPLGASSPPVERAAQVEDVARIRAEITDLPEGQRLAFLLHFQEGLNDREVAYALGISHQAARHKICRAASRLRARLKETL